MPLSTEIESFLAKQEGLQCGRGATEDELRAITTIWGSLPEDYETFLRKYGWVSFGSDDLPGVGPGVPTRADLLMLARLQWSAGVPRELLPIYYPGGDWNYCLSKLHPNTPVVVWSIDCGKHQPYDEIYPSWTNWFMTLFKVRK